jgi:hypothetical protein
MSSQRCHDVRTVDGKISKSGTSSTLDLGVMAAEEKEDRIKCFTTYGSDLFLGYFSECKSGASLEVNVVGKRECCQRGQWGAREEVGVRAILGG